MYKRNVSLAVIFKSTLKENTCSNCQCLLPLATTSLVLRGLVLPSRQTASRDKAQRSKCRVGAPVKNEDVDELSNTL